MKLRSVLAAALFSGLLAFLPAAPANAGCSWVKVEYMVSGAIRIKWEWRCSDTSGQGLQPVGTQQPPRDSNWDAVCVRTAIAVGADPVSYCDLPNNAVPPTVTPGLVARAFRNIPLPPAELSVQPPNGRTLVNFATNFYTEQGPFTRSVRLLGQRVDLRIWPSQYRWVFGDGVDLASESAGAPYPHLLVTHNYRRAGSVSPRVDTTYAAQFSVNGGPWRDVSGTVTIPGSPVGLDVTTAGPVLVGYH